jgi:hypothetical protein
MTVNISVVECNEFERYVLAGVPVEKAREYARQDVIEHENRRDDDA